MANAERGTRGVIRALEGVVRVHDARYTCHAPLVTVPIIFSLIIFIYYFIYFLLLFLFIIFIYLIIKNVFN